MIDFALTFMLLVILIILGVAIFSFVFWLKMLIDAAKRNFKNEENEKIVWILIIIFTGLIVALIYYFVVRRKNEKKR